MKPATLYWAIGGLSLFAVGGIIWKVFFPIKPNSAAAAAGNALVNNPAANAPAAGSGTPPASNAGANATTPAASTNLGYTSIPFSMVQVGNQLYAENDTIIYLPGHAAYFSEQYYTIPKGQFIGQVLTVFGTGASVRNFDIAVPHGYYFAPGDKPTVFYIKSNTYRKKT